MFKDLFVTIRHMWKEPAGRALILGFFGIILAGTVFYSIVEGWSLISSFYFTVVMLTTVGFGDFYPTTDFSRLVTVLFIFVGVAFILGFLNFIMSRTVQRRAEEKFGQTIPPGAPGYTAPRPELPVDDSTET